MALQIDISQKAYKDLKNIDNKEAIKILESIKKLADFPDAPNIKRLTNFSPSYRFRIGDYRVLFEVDNQTIVIYRILHRKESYA